MPQTESEQDNGGSKDTNLKQLPPSAKLVMKTLEYEGPLPQNEISQRSRLSPRTTRFALKQLTESRVVEARQSVKDGRRYIYCLADGESEEIETLAD
ncbi:MAG: helix-turn-helix domain-containing protein [Halobacteria archaeon]|nr:helix-turn-helix domain-containing protein [Halobacteria archaeon]